MELVTPGIGLLFWMTLSFAIVLFILSKFAWKPIAESIKKREDSIETALQSAEKAKVEMAKLLANNEQLLRQAQIERDLLLKEARDAKDAIISEAKNQAKVERDRDLQKAREEIHIEKEAAKKEIKNMVAQLSIDIAEKLLKKELSAENKSNDLVKTFIDDLKLN
jgi:F-type H+-transporting ATPase subunit b